jgi:hypothetical protein
MASGGVHFFAGRFIAAARQASHRLLCDGMVTVMTRRELLLGSMLPAAGKRNPNLILLLADDMGCGDPSCHGNTLLRTPHLDALAAGGVRFENVYAASAVSTPSRAAILTGRFPLRFDIESDPLEELNLLEKEPEVVERLAAEVRAHLTAKRDRRGAVGEAQ